MGKKLPIRIILAGCEPEVQLRVAPALVKVAQRRPGQIELAAAFSAVLGHAQSASKAFGFALAADNLDELLTKAAPGMVVCALAANEGQHRSRLLSLGTPTLFIPPLGSLQDALALSETVREKPTPHMVAMTRRFSPYLGRAVQWARQLRDIAEVRAHLKTPGEIDGPFIWTSAVHALDAISYILGRIEGFELTVEEGKTSQAVVALTFASGAKGHLELQGRCDHTEESYELVSDGYQATVILQALAGPSMQCWRGPKVEVHIQGPPNQPAVEYDGMQEVLSAFIDALISGEKPSPALDDVLPALDVSHRIAAKLTPASRAATAQSAPVPVGAA